MQLNQWEVIILKPGRAFLSYLSSQIPEISLPSLKLLQKNCTAYVMARQKDNESTLDEIERHFTCMFRHEISRWSGIDNIRELKGSFLDFLCCFKFELHTGILLMENFLAEGKQLLRIKPRLALLDWIRSTVGDHGETVNILDKINLSQLTGNSTLIIKNFQNLEEIKFVLTEHYQAIFKAEMCRMDDVVEQQPAVNSYQDFLDYFSVDLHTQLIHLY